MLEAEVIGTHIAEFEGIPASHRDQVSAAV
jgi:hypothetical protein